MKTGHQLETSCRTDGQTISGLRADRVMYRDQEGPILLLSLMDSRTSSP